MLGLGGASYHFEFTHCRAHPVPPTPTPEDLVVFYIPANAEWERACSKMLAAGFTQVASLNPYWEVRGRTFQDHDGYRVVLQNAEWSNGEVPRLGAACRIVLLVVWTLLTPLTYVGLRSTNTMVPPGPAVPA
jgi:hypothetical protein